MRCSALQCVVVRCSVLQCVANKGCCVTGESPAEFMLQHIAACCSVLQRIAVRCSVCIGGCYRTLHRVVLCCIVLQCIAVRVTDEVHAGFALGIKDALALEIRTFEVRGFFF